jgi:1,4-alpha-glucan branching enzyme
VPANLNCCAKGTEKFGFIVGKDNEITYREWAPGATEAYLIGDFSKSNLYRLSQVAGPANNGKMVGTEDPIP